MTVKKICCLVLDEAGVPMGAMIAARCPEIKVTVVHTNPERVFLWNAKQIPDFSYPRGLDDFVRKCHNKNLCFTTNEEDAIREADVIFIMSHSKQKTFGEGQGKVVDLAPIVSAAHSIVEHAETDKIVVECSAIPLGASDCVRKILNTNMRPKINFQVISIPEFYEEGSPLVHLSIPDVILIGYENRPGSQEAVKELSVIYQRWTPVDRINTMSSNWTAELSKICICAFAAQKLASVYAISAICEKTGGNLAEIARVINKDSRFGFKSLDYSFSFGTFPETLLNLIYLCESKHLTELADYWRQVLEMQQYHKERFMTRLFEALNRTVLGRRIAVLGFTFYKDTTVTKGSASIDICKHLLKEGAVINVYDPKLSQPQVIENLKSAGCKNNEENLEKVVSVFSNLYKATHKVQAIIFCGDWTEFLCLDFKRIFSEMEKPAYVFDCENILPHEELVKTGFKVVSIGKIVKNH